MRRDHTADNSIDADLVLAHLPRHGTLIGCNMTLDTQSPHLASQHCVAGQARSRVQRATIVRALGFDGRGRTNTSLAEMAVAVFTQHDDSHKHHKEAHSFIDQRKPCRHGWRISYQGESLPVASLLTETIVTLRTTLSQIVHPNCSTHTTLVRSGTSNQRLYCSGRHCRLTTQKNVYLIHVHVAKKQSSIVAGRIGQARAHEGRVIRAMSTAIRSCQQPLGRALGHSG